MFTLIDQDVNPSPATTSTTHIVGAVDVQVGDLIVAQFAIRDNFACSSMVGSVNGAFSAAGSQQNSGNLRTGIFYKVATSAGGEVVTGTFADTVRGGINVSVWRPAGEAALDQTGGNTNTATSAHANGSIITADEDVLVIDCFVFTADHQGPTQTGFTALTPSPGFTRDYFSYLLNAGTVSEDADLTTALTPSSVGNIASFTDIAGAGSAAPTLYVNRGNLRLN